MAAKFMKIKKLVIPFITLLVIVSGCAGVAMLSQTEAWEELRKGTEVVIEYSEPDRLQQELVNNHVNYIGGGQTSQEILENLEDPNDEEKEGGIDLEYYYAKAHSEVWSNPNNWLNDYNNIQNELNLLHSMLSGYKGINFSQLDSNYMTWRLEKHPENPYIGRYEKFDGQLEVISDYVVLYKLPIESDEYKNHEAVKGQIFNTVEISESRDWYRIYSANNAVSYIKNDGSVVKVDSAQSQSGFAEALYAVYVKPEYIQNGTGVPVWDKYKIDTSLGLKGMKNEVFRTLANSSTPYVVVGVGYGDADGYIQILDTKRGITGYTNAEWFTQDPAETTIEQAPVEQQKPAEQQKPTEQQKPVEQQKPAEQQKPTGQGAIDSSLLGEYNDPLTSGRATIPDDQQIPGEGNIGHFENDNEGEFYHGNLSG